MDISTKRRLLHLFFPTRCPVCNGLIGAEERFCSKCLSELKRFSGGHAIAGAESFTGAFEYNDRISPGIMLMKRGICGNADYAFGGELADALRENGVADKVDVIIPVPLHPSSKRRRTFNQSELIAKVVGRELSLPVCADAVKKIRSTPDQKHMTRILRKFNLIDAFAVVDAEAVRGKSVLLIDDVCTTGSTLAELTGLLRKSGARAVHCAACCKTPPLKMKDGGSK